MATGATPELSARPRVPSLSRPAIDGYEVPIDGTNRALALVKPGRASSQFVDPANPDAGLITWQGSWRSLGRAWTFAPHLENFGQVWDLLEYPRLLFNTIVIAV